MVGLLLAVIYLAFISLGLPDSLLGSAWPVVYSQFGVPLSYAGIISMIIAGGTILASLLSDRLTKKIGAGLVTAISVMLTAMALFGFSVSKSFLALCLWSIPYGLGAGAVDAALNNYVALHFAARHMSWLHCFWGVGASISPYIMSYCLTGGMGWRTGYGFVSLIQITLTFIIFFSLPLWKRQATKAEEEVPTHVLSIPKALRIKGVKPVLFMFFSYCALETTAGLWASTYLVEARNTDVGIAAKFASLFYLGITVGRFLCGFVSEKLGDKRLIKYGIYIMLIGIIFIIIPIHTSFLALIGLIILGFGCAPVYPSIIHATPDNFGKNNSQSIIGIQMASAYLGSTFMPPLFGLIADNITVSIYPYFMLIFAVVMLVMSNFSPKTT